MIYSCKVSLESENWPRVSEGKEREEYIYLYIVLSLYPPLNFHSSINLKNWNLFNLWNLHNFRTFLSFLFNF